MTYKLICTDFYKTDSPTGGTALEYEDGSKSFLGDSNDFQPFDEVDEAWDWLGIDPANLPEDELVEGDHLDDQYTRHYERVGESVIVTDTPTTEFWASSRITQRRFQVVRA